MINGIHAIVYSPAAEDVRMFFRDVLGLPSVDVGGGWLIFGLPPAELAVHPADEAGHQIYLVCEDLDATLRALAERGILPVRPVSEQAWGRLTAIALPDGSEIALYQPSHARPTTG